MTTLEINQEIQNTKMIMAKLLDCVKTGQKEYYQDYINASTYYIKLMRVKPDHSFTLSN